MAPLLSSAYIVIVFWVEKNSADLLLLLLHLPHHCADLQPCDRWGEEVKKISTTWREKPDHGENQVCVGVIVENSSFSC